MIARLHVKNCWESLNWFIDTELIEDPTSIKRVKIDGQEYEVKWKHMSVEYDDMGHTYSASSWHGFITEPTFKNKISLELLLNDKKKIEVLK